MLRFPNTRYSQTTRSHLQAQCYMSNGREITQNKHARGVPATSPISLQQVSFLRQPAKGGSGVTQTAPTLVASYNHHLFSNVTMQKRKRGCSPARKPRGESPHLPHSHTHLPVHPHLLQGLSRGLPGHQHQIRLGR